MAAVLTWVGVTLYLVAAALVQGAAHALPLLPDTDAFSGGSLEVRAGRTPAAAVRGLPLLGCCRCGRVILPHNCAPAPPPFSNLPHTRAPTCTHAHLLCRRLPHRSWPACLCWPPPTPAR
jgi:hypothetical protein